MTAPRSAPPGDRVLAVEDDVASARLLEAALRPAYDVEVVRTAEEAFDRLGRVRPRVLVTAVALPGMSGLDLVRRVRNASAAPRCSVLVVSSLATRADAFAAGADDFLAKPFTPQSLAGAVRRLVAI
jgi:DNA-binding response OmpR family regulator